MYRLSSIHWDPSSLADEVDMFPCNNKEKHIYPCHGPRFERRQAPDPVPCTSFSALAPSMQLKTRRRVMDVVAFAHLFRDAAIQSNKLRLGRRAGLI